MHARDKRKRKRLVCLHTHVGGIWDAERDFARRRVARDAVELPRAFART
jgi:hypothetical protein